MKIKGTSDARWLTPPGKTGGVCGCNDNERDLMTGNLEQDLKTLLARWNLQDKAGTLHIIASQFRRAITRSTSDLSQAYLLTMTGNDAVWTAAAMGMCQALFKWIDFLPVPEKIYVLNEIGRHADCVAAEMRGAAPAPEAAIPPDEPGDAA